MSQRYPVFIGGKRFDADFQTKKEFRKGWQSVLRKAAESQPDMGAVRCGCPGLLPRPLYVRTRGDQYHLACWPNMGANHAKNCRHYSFDKFRSGIQGYSDNVVTMTSQGFLDVQLANNTGDASDSSRRQMRNVILNGNRYCQSAMTISGLLHLLWQESSLNVWHPAMQGKRNFWNVISHAYQTARRIGSAKGNLGGVLVLPADKDTKYSARNQSLLESCYKDNRKLYVLGVMARYKESDGEGFPESPRFAKPFGYPRIFLSDSQIEEVSKSYAPEIEGWKKGERLVVLIQTKVQKSKKTGRLYSRALGVGLMLVSPEWIPAATMDELALIESMISQGRAFDKALRFDSVDAVFPDFWLLDMGEPYPLEVWATDTEEGKLRQAAKTAFYNEKHPGQWWQWNAVAGEAMPELPARPSEKSE